MFTKNWDKDIVAAVLSEPSAANLYAKNVNGELKKISYATMLEIGRAYDYPKCPSIYYLRDSYEKGGGVVLGTGTTQPTYEDYKLSGNLVSGYNYTKTVTIANEENRASITAAYTITNTTSSPFTIGEIGLVADILTGGNNSSQYKCLLERTVLDSPVTIPAGGVGQITYTITIEYPA